MNNGERYNLQRNKSNSKIKIEYEGQKHEQKQQNSSLDNYIIQRKQINDSIEARTKAEKENADATAEITKQITEEIKKQVAEEIKNKTTNIFDPK